MPVTMTTRPFFAALCALSLLALVGACERGPSPDDRAAVAQAESEPIDGARLYQRRCATCHGARGAGDGPSSAAYPQVSDLRSPQVQSRHSDDELAEIITDGYRRMPRVGGLNRDERSAIIAYVRTLGQ